MPICIGQSVERVDVREKVLGHTLFAGDFNRPGQAYMKMLFAERPHAIIHNIDTSAAEGLPGVLAVLTAKDTGRNAWGLLEADQPVLCGPGSEAPYADRVRFIGDQVALVVAESEGIATEAVNRIAVEYEDLPVLTDAELAMRPDAPLIHPDRGSNIFAHFRIRFGDPQVGFTQAAVVVEAEYHTPSQEHAYLQTEAGVAYMDEQGRITIITGGQGPHEDAMLTADALGLPHEQVRVIYGAVGGGFGGKGYPSVQIALGLAVLKLHQRGIDRPVKLVWSRPESIRGHPKRHPFVIRARWAADRDGKLTAIEQTLIQAGGPYFTISDRVLGNAIQTATGLYYVPNVKVDGFGVYTNHVTGGAFRGFGSTQATFAAECQMGKLAEALGLDPVEFRMRNVLRDGMLRPLGSPLPPGARVEDVLAEGAKHAGWRETEKGWRKPNVRAQDDGEAMVAKRRGIGFACGFKNTGFSYGMQDESIVTIELHGGAEIEKVIVRQIAAEIGQGLHTVIAQMSAEALGVPVEKIELISEDTSEAPSGGTAGASRMTFMSGNAIIGAAREALQKWKDEDRPAIATFTFRAPETSFFDSETGQSSPSYAYGYVSQIVTVEVDTETGECHIIDVVSANDVGKAINPQLIEGQIEGAVSQAAGHAFMEDFRQEGGYVQTDRLSTYLIPTTLDVPDRVRSLILEYPDPNGPWGVRGLGEMPFVPFTAAAMAAVHDATGIWFDEFPVTPEKMLAALHQAKDE